MARHSLRIVIVLGMLITLVGGTGTFALFADQASTGENDITSGSLPKAADVRIETASIDPTNSIITCNGDTWDKDNLTTGLYSASNVQPGDDLGTTFVCLKNVGSGSLSLTGTAFGKTSLDVACTGDEALAGDTTCGLDAQNVPQAGELLPLIFVGMNRVSCATNTDVVANDPQPLSALTDFNFFGLGGSLLPNEIACIRIQVTYPTPESVSSAQVAQSDEVTWRFRFDAITF
jgi:predicted ribosomally synthesized peptide with SipW-like signal peptide